MAVTILAPIRRVLYIWQDYDTGFLSFAFGQGQYIVLVALVLGALIIRGWENAKAVRLLDEMLKAGKVLALTVIILLLFLALTLTRVPGWWWTWFTLGVHIGTVALGCYILKGRMRPTRAFLLSVGLVLIAIGVWEIAYQCGLWYYNDRPQGVGTLNLIGQIRFMSWFVIAGGAVVWLTKLKGIFRMSYGSAALLLLAVAAVVTWHMLGFWLDIRFDWSTLTWYQPEESDPLSMGIYRSSKVFLNLGLIALVARGEQKQLPVRVQPLQQRTRLPLKNEKTVGVADETLDDAD